VSFFCETPAQNGQIKSKTAKSHPERKLKQQNPSQSGKTTSLSRNHAAKPSIQAAELPQTTVESRNHPLNQVSKQQISPKKSSPGIRILYKNARPPARMRKYHLNKYILIENGFVKIS